MSDTAPTEKEKKSSKKNTPLGKIETAKIEVDNLEKVEEVPVFVPKEQSDTREKSLITAVRNLLKEFGIRKSAAAIRNAVEMPHDEFMPQHAVSALSVLGFKASFGNISIKKLEKDFFPLIAFLKNGEAVMLKEMANENEISIIKFDDKKSSVKISTESFKNDFSGYIILSKELNDREKHERSGHWFFSAFRKDPLNI